MKEVFFMFQFMVNGDGGLTTAGYVICILAGIVLFGLAIFFPERIPKAKKCLPGSWYSARWQWPLLL